MKSNICLLTDSYKLTHYKQYPIGTQNIYSYFESRGGKFNEIVFFGLNYYIKEYLSKPFTKDNILEAEIFTDKHIGKNLFNSAGWYHLFEKHKGHLPIKIHAVPEGTVVPVHNILLSVEVTDPNFPWLTNYLETLLSKLWYTCTVATLSREIKKIIKSYLIKTSDSLESLPFKLHDFGYRGVSSEESAALGGAAHLINFLGSDTIAGIRLLQYYYNCTTNMPGYSVNAAEHSTITSWGKNHEVDSYRNLIQQFPNGILSVVADSYDVYKAVSQYFGIELKNLILDRNGTFVVRPDSGIPEEVVLKVTELLGDKFGYEINSKGYKILHPKIRVIQGDGININSIPIILENLSKNGWSTDNLVLGMGGGLLQQIDRDTQKFAFKCSAARINDNDIQVFKDPITDPGKRSKAGYMKLILDNNILTTKCFNTLDEYRKNENDNILQEVNIYEYDENLDNIRNRAEIYE